MRPFLYLFFTLCAVSASAQHADAWQRLEATFQNGSYLRSARIFKP